MTSQRFFGNNPVFVLLRERLPSGTPASVLYATAVGATFLLPILLLLATADLAIGQIDDPAHPAIASERERQWILVVPSEFVEASRPLLVRRREQGWKTRVMEVKPEEPLSAVKLVRQLLSVTREFEGTSCVLLFGSWEHVPAGTGSRGRMILKPTDQPYGLPRNEAVTVAVGRLPVRNAEEARGVVDKIIRFEQSIPDSNRMSMVLAHPGGVSSTERTVAERVVGSAVKKRVRQIEDRWEIFGAADFPGTEYSVDSAAFAKQSREQFSNQQQFAAFFGHSSPDALWSTSGPFLKRDSFGDEPLLDSTGVFFSCGCFGAQTAGKNGVGYGVTAIRSSDGPAAFIGAYGISYAAFGQMALDGLLGAVADKDGESDDEANAGAAGGVVHEAAQDEKTNTEKTNTEKTDTEKTDANGATEKGLVENGLVENGLVEKSSGGKFSTPRTLLLGETWLAVQHSLLDGKIGSFEFYLYDMADGSGGKVPLAKQRLEHAQMWTLLGDPAMTIPLAD